MMSHALGRDIFEELHKVFTKRHSWTGEEAEIQSDSVLLKALKQIPMERNCSCQVVTESYVEPQKGKFVSL